MAKFGQARVLSPAEQRHVFDVIKLNRHPEKNTAIMQLSFKLGLRVQEIALLELKEVCEIGVFGSRKFRLHQVMTLPALYTKGSGALSRSRSAYERKSVTFTVAEFQRVLSQVEALAKAGVRVDPEKFYPPVGRRRGRSRDLPLVDSALREALSTYLELRLESDPGAKLTDPLFVTQKGGPYSPNTLQEHMALILRRWAGIEKASSHSGRRSLITDVIHNQGKSVKVAQKLAGHVSPATTLIYEEPPEEELADALNNIGR